MGSDLKMGSDGESDQASATSSDEVQSPVRVRMRNHPPRKISTEVLTPLSGQWWWGWERGLDLRRWSSWSCFSHLAC